MEKLTRYREAVRKLIEEYAGHESAAHGVRSFPMIDPVNDHYVAMQTGWVNRHRVQGAFLHLDIIDGKVWIQFNGTDQQIADELISAGVAREDIVLGEQPPERRPLTGYGVG